MGLAVDGTLDHLHERSTVLNLNRSLHSEWTDVAFFHFFFHFLVDTAASQTNQLIAISHPIVVSQSKKKKDKKNSKK